MQFIVIFIIFHHNLYQIGLIFKPNNYCKTYFYNSYLCYRPHVVALILARGGSKGIPRKNLAEIQNITLLQRSLDTINDCGRMKII